MTPETALTIVANVTGLAALTREQHQQVLAALEVLKQAIAPKPEEPNEST